MTILHGFEFLKALVECDKPLIAAVDGPAVGIGTTLMFHCDMVFASPRAMLQTPFVDLGLLPEAGSSLLGPRVLGHARAFELLVMGEPWSAEQAKEAGLVNAIVPSEGLESAALQAAKRLRRSHAKACAWRGGSYAEMPPRSKPGWRKREHSFCRESGRMKPRRRLRRS